MTTAAAAPAPAEASTAPVAEAAEGGAETSEAELPKSLNELLEARKAPAPKGKAKAAAKPEPATEEAEPEAEAPAEGETEEASQPEAAPPDPEEITSEKLFSDEALSSPEGIARAREIMLAAKEHLEKRHRKFDRADIKLKRREAGVVQREQAVAAQETQVQKLRGVGRSFMEKMQTIKGARATTPTAILVHLDELAGGPGTVESGRDLYEEITLALARDGKQPQPTKAERELADKLERIERQREADRVEAARERENYERQRLTQSIAQVERSIAATATNPKLYPGIAGIVARGATSPEAVAKWVGDLMTEAYNEGTPLDLSTAIGMLEERVSPPAARAPQGEPGSVQPNRTRRTPNGVSVLPHQADLSSGRGRPLTHEERLSDLSRDPSFWSELGLPNVG
jgi:hypothetical protein